MPSRSSVPGAFAESHGVVLVVRVSHRPLRSSEWWVWVRQVALPRLQSHPWLTTVPLPAGHSHHHWLWGQGAPDVGREDHCLLLLCLCHLLLCAPSGRCSMVCFPQLLGQLGPWGGCTPLPLSRPAYVQNQEGASLLEGAILQSSTCLPWGPGCRLPVCSPHWGPCRQCGRQPGVTVHGHSVGQACLLSPGGGQ